MTVKTRGRKNGILEWVTTDDNNSDPDTGRVDSGPAVGEPSIHGPIAKAEIDNDGFIDTGSTSSMPVVSSEPSQNYTMYAVSTLVGAPDPWDDPVVFVTWAVANPVPSSWGLTFSGMSGTTDLDGASSGTSVSVPDDPALDGSTFYLVALVDSEDPEVYAKVPSWPGHKVTIKVP